MYRGFNLTLGENFFDSFYDFVELGETHLASGKAQTEKRLMDYLYNDNAIDGTKLMEDWFPEIKADIFISHSHANKELANALAGWLNSKFGLDVFIDSNVWGYSSELLEKINDKYSNKRPDGKGGWLYTHSKCTLASQHVNLMLSTALQKMIDKTECIIFLNTNKSVKKKVYTDNCINETHSPWIYSEILCTQVIEKTIPARLKKQELRHDEKIYECASMQESLDIAYKLSLDHLTKIDCDMLHSWEDKAKKASGVLALDALYFLTKGELYNE